MHETPDGGDLLEGTVLENLEPTLGELLVERRPLSSSVPAQNAKILRN